MICDKKKMNPTPLRWKQSLHIFDIFAIENHKWTFTKIGENLVKSFLYINSFVFSIIIMKHFEWMMIASMFETLNSATDTKPTDPTEIIKKQAITQRQIIHSQS